MCVISCVYVYLERPPYDGRGMWTVRGWRSTTVCSARGYMVGLLDSRGIGESRV